MDSSGLTCVAGMVLLTLALGWPAGPVAADGSAVVLLDESFEQAFPSPPWRVEHLPGAAAVDWGRNALRATDGSRSLYCAADGPAAPGDGGPAPANTASWAIAGPFDLSETTSGALSFDLWLRTERYHDVFLWLVSTDGVTFSGSARSSDTDGWQTISTDLADWGAAGSVLGQGAVWIAFVYQSDHNHLFEGAYLDRVSLTVDYGTPGDEGKTYTSNADFALGSMVGLESTAGRLELSDGWDALPYVWVPNSATGTVSKLSAGSGDELGRYATGASDEVDPGVAAVDLDGACWVGNRDAGTVVKIGLDENGGCVDRDGNGEIDTSRDNNGDGTISGSELLDWGTDECVLLEVVLVKDKEGVHVPGDGHGDTAANNLQALAVSPDGDVWAGVYDSQMLYRLDGASGSVLDTIDLADEATSPTALAVTPDGAVWATSWPDEWLLKFDPSAAEATKFPLSVRGRVVTAGGADRLFVTSYEDQTLSRVDPSTGAVAWDQYAGWRANGLATTSGGDIWVAAPGNNNVNHFNPQGYLLWKLNLFGEPTSTAVDQDGKVWVLSSTSESVYRIDPTISVTDLEKVVTGGGSHNATGDLTGIVARNVTSRYGSWTVTWDSGTSLRPWGLVTWQGTQPNGTEISVRVRSSEDRDGWSSWETVVSGEALAATPPGRYIEIQANLHRSSGSSLPTLDELTVKPSTTTAAPIASFNWSPAQPVAGEMVAFTDTSTGDPTSWTWVFDDGGTSSEQNPSHGFVAAGSYQVELTATNDQGSDTASMTIMVDQLPTCSLTCSTTAPRTVETGQMAVFEADVTASGCAGDVAFGWDFGDGSASTEQNPTHQYQVTGTLRWDFTATIDGESCHRAGDITVSGAGPAQCDLTWWVPVASRQNGVNGSVWRTDVGLLGRDNGDVAVELRLHDGDEVVVRTVTVAPLAMVDLVDVVDWIDPGRVGSGALEICADGMLTVSSRTANVLAPGHACFPEGSFGQFLAGAVSGDGLGAGDQAWLAQLRESIGFRTNIGVVNTGEVAAQVEIQLRDATGAGLAVFQLDLEPGQWTQDNRPFLNRVGRSDLDAASASVSVITGDGIFAYASVIDNLTNDATTVPMQR